MVQPLEEGFTQITEKLNKEQKLVWFNMRQEPVAYIQVCLLYVSRQRILKIQQTIRACELFNKTKYFRLRQSDGVGTERLETDLRLDLRLT